MKMTVTSYLSPEKKLAIEQLSLKELINNLFLGSIQLVCLALVIFVLRENFISPPNTFMAFVGQPILFLLLLALFDFFSKKLELSNKEEC